MLKRPFFLFFLVFVFVEYAWCSNDDFYLAKGALAEQKGKYEDAVEYYNKAVEINPNKIEIYLSIGRIYEKDLNANGKAITNYKKGLEFNPNNFYLNRALMYLYFSSNDLDKGLKIYEFLSQISTGNDKYFMPRDVVEKLMAEMPMLDLIELSKKYVQINPPDIILRELIANDFREKKLYLDAQREYEILLKYSSDKGPIYFALAECAYNLKNYDDAFLYLRKAESFGEDVPKEYFEMVEGKKSENGVAP